MANYNVGSLKNPIDKTGDEKWCKYIHFYFTKGAKCFKPICLGVYIQATSLGKWERGFYIRDVKQTSTPDRITCPECLKKYLPYHIKKNSKYLYKLNKEINGGSK